MQANSMSPLEDFHVQCNLLIPTACPMQPKLVLRTMFMGAFGDTGGKKVIRHRQQSFHLQKFLGSSIPKSLLIAHTNSSNPSIGKFPNSTLNLDTTWVILRSSNYQFDFVTDSLSQQHVKIIFDPDPQTLSETFPFLSVTVWACTHVNKTKWGFGLLSWATEGPRCTDNHFPPPEWH